MRGISGIIHLDGTPVAPSQVQGMIRHMAVGPIDRLNHWCEGSAGLAHLIKEITPEDRFEAQPLLSSDHGTVLVTDALLENRAELTAELGWTPAEAATRPDSALVLAAWQRWGDASPLHLESSSHTVVLWQPRTRQLCCFGSHLGGCLYYWHRRGIFAFASTLRGLFALPEVSRELDEVALAEHLVRVAHAPTHTLYREVRRLEPGTLLRITPERSETITYWRAPEPTELRLRSDADYVDAYRHELTAAVRRKLRTQNNVACLVSGGLDSCAIAAIAGQILAERGQRLQVIHTLPAGQSRYRWALRELDESAYVRLLEQHSPHLDFHYQPANTTPLPLDQWNRFFELNHIPPSTLPSAPDHVFKQFLRGHHIDTILSGVGGNLVVSMESRPWNYLRHLASERRWLRYARELWGYHRVYGWPLRGLLRESLSPRARPSAAAEIDSRLRLLNPDFRRRSGIDERLRELRENSEAIGDLRARIHRHATGPMLRGQGTPGASLGEDAVALEFAPMCDRRLNEFCRTLPFDQQIRGGWDRRLLRLATTALLPPEIRWRTTRGLPQPAFQFKYSNFIAPLGGSEGCLAALPHAPAYIDLSWVRDQASATGSERIWATQVAVVRTLLLDRFLEWQFSAR